MRAALAERYSRFTARYTDQIFAQLAGYFPDSATEIHTELYEFLDGHQDDYVNLAGRVGLIMRGHKLATLLQIPVTWLADQFSLGLLMELSIEQMTQYMPSIESTTNAGENYRFQMLCHIWPKYTEGQEATELNPLVQRLLSEHCDNIPILASQLQLLEQNFPGAVQSQLSENLFAVYSAASQSINAIILQSLLPMGEGRLPLLQRIFATLTDEQMCIRLSYADATVKALEGVPLLEWSRQYQTWLEQRFFYPDDGASSAVEEMNVLEASLRMQVAAIMQALRSYFDQHFELVGGEIKAKSRTANEELIGKWRELTSLCKSRKYQELSTVDFTGIANLEHPMLAFRQSYCEVHKKLEQLFQAQKTLGLLIVPATSSLLSTPALAEHYANLLKQKLTTLLAAEVEPETTFHSTEANKDDYLQDACQVFQMNETATRLCQTLVERERALPAHYVHSMTECMLVNPSSPGDNEAGYRALQEALIKINQGFGTDRAIHGMVLNIFTNHFVTCILVKNSNKELELLVLDPSSIRGADFYSSDNIEQRSIARFKAAFRCILPKIKIQYVFCNLMRAERDCGFLAYEMLLKAMRCSWQNIVSGKFVRDAQQSQAQCTPERALHYPRRVGCRAHDVRRALTTKMQELSMAPATFLQLGETLEQSVLAQSGEETQAPRAEFYRRLRDEKPPLQSIEQLIENLLVERNEQISLYFKALSELHPNLLRVFDIRCQFIDSEQEQDFEMRRLVTAAYSAEIVGVILRRVQEVSLKPLRANFSLTMLQDHVLSPEQSAILDVLPMETRVCCLNQATEDLGRRLFDYHYNAETKSLVQTSLRQYLLEQGESVTVDQYITQVMMRHADLRLAASVLSEFSPELKLQLQNEVKAALTQIKSEYIERIAAQLNQRLTTRSPSPEGAGDGEFRPIHDPYVRYYDPEDSSFCELNYDCIPEMLAQQREFKIYIAQTSQSDHDGNFLAALNARFRLLQLERCLPRFLSELETYLQSDAITFETLLEVDWLQLFSTLPLKLCNTAKHLAISDNANSMSQIDEIYRRVLADKMSIKLTQKLQAMHLNELFSNIDHGKSVVQQSDLHLALLLSKQQSGNIQIQSLVENLFPATAPKPEPDLVDVTLYAVNVLIRNHQIAILLHDFTGAIAFFEIKVASKWKTLCETVQQNLNEFQDTCSGKNLEALSLGEIQELQSDLNPKVKQCVEQVFTMIVKGDTSFQKLSVHARIFLVQLFSITNYPVVIAGRQQTHALPSFLTFRQTMHLDLYLCGFKERFLEQLFQPSVNQASPLFIYPHVDSPINCLGKAFSVALLQQKLAEWYSRQKNGYLESLKEPPLISELVELTQQPEEAPIKDSFARLLRRCVAAATATEGSELVFELGLANEFVTTGYLLHLEKLIKRYFDPRIKFTHDEVSDVQQRYLQNMPQATQTGGALFSGRPRLITELESCFKKVRTLHKKPTASQEVQLNCHEIENIAAILSTNASDLSSDQVFTSLSAEQHLCIVIAYDIARVLGRNSPWCILKPGNYLDVEITDPAHKGLPALKPADSLHGAAP